PGLIDKVKEKLTDITTYLGYIGPIVGGVSFLANALAPVTKRMVSIPALNAFQAGIEASGS
ncbi:unnamed protein product, partial [marine sediment metagenome]